MASLNKPRLGTSPETGWMFYSVHLASSYVVKEFLLAGNYRQCLRISEPDPGEVGPWAKEMRSQDYHELHVHSVIGMWAAFEAGIEDTLAAFVRSDPKAASMAVSAIRKAHLYPTEAWPWSDSICLEIAQKIDTVAKNSTPEGGVDLFGRIRTAFAIIGIQIPANPQLAAKLAEASRLRNVLVHRNGQVSPKDAEAVPSLGPWVGSVVPIDTDRFRSLYESISACLVTLVGAIAASDYRPNR